VAVADADKVVPANTYSAEDLGSRACKCRKGHVVEMLACAQID
jgi:hypothetical protein